MKDNWIKEFDEKFNNIGTSWEYCEAEKIDEIKKFISQTIKERDEEWLSKFKYLHDTGTHLFDLEDVEQIKKNLK